jgi:hypothetical protein
MKAIRLKGSGGLDRPTVVEMDEPGSPGRPATADGIDAPATSS